VRGDVYRLKPRSARGHEQQGERYAVVVQANAYHDLSAWLVAPTTTKSFGSMIHRRSGADMTLQRVAFDPPGWEAAAAEHERQVLGRAAQHSA
jgi:mRNA-degrading endonuclease toxin of MazEF toxin-antitoxin module